MSKFYCPECGKQGCVSVYLWAVLLIAIGFFMGAGLLILIWNTDFSSPSSGPGDSQTVNPTASDTPALTNFSPSSEPGAEVAPMEAPAQYITMNVSAYCPCEICCGKWSDGFTASGVPAEGRICAAPPEYPFGTVLEVEGYGEYVVQDRGGAIKGDKLDLLFSGFKDNTLNHQAALEFGRKTLKVRIIMEYVIKWRSKITGESGEGTTRFSKQDATEEVASLNRKWPNIKHWYEDPTRRHNSSPSDAVPYWEKVKARMEAK